MNPHQEEAVYGAKLMIEQLSQGPQIGIRAPNHDELEIAALGARSMMRHAREEIGNAWRDLPEWLRWAINLNPTLNALRTRELVCLIKTHERVQDAADLVCVWGSIIGVYVARYHREMRHLGLEDLIWIGCRGLGDAVRAYDPEGSHDFSAMVSWYISAAFTNAIESGGPPRSNEDPEGGGRKRGKPRSRDRDTLAMLTEIASVREWADEIVTDTLIDELRADADGRVTFPLVLAVVARHFGHRPSEVLERTHAAALRRASGIAMLLGNQCAKTSFTRLTNFFGCEMSFVNSCINRMRAEMSNPGVDADMTAICHALGVPIPHTKRAALPAA